MGIEYFRLTNFSGTSEALRELPSVTWWILGLGAAFLVFWTIKR